MIREQLILVLEESQEIIADFREFNLQFELVYPRDLFVEIIIASLELTDTRAFDEITVLYKIIVEEFDSNK